ncbi:MAG: hypothetical protein EOM22_16160 [Gammaproteobacteria bacterium]|nr:hypothetical protein [Gammaproteobacteria bacterium]
MSIDFLVYEPEKSEPEDRRWIFRNDLPKANLGNQSAAAVLRLLGLQPDNEYPSGMLASDQLPELRRTILRLLNLGDAEMSALAYEPFVASDPGRCTLIDCGLSSERIHRALRQIEPVIQAAQTHRLWFGWG